MTEHRKRVLLVEDNPGDVVLFREAAQEVGIVMDLELARDVDQALASLRGRRTPEVLPDLIFLDLNLPGGSGFQVLAAVKGDPDLAGVPVIVLTSSKVEHDVIKSYSAQASSFVTKPVGLDGYIRMMRILGDYWFTLTRLPVV